MDKICQANLMTGALQDFRAGTMSLGTLIDRIEGILGVIGDRAFKDETFGDFLALEEVYARTCIGDFDYALHGRPVVDRAVSNLLEKTRASSAPEH